MRSAWAIQRDCVSKRGGGYTRRGVVENERVNSDTCGDRQKDRGLWEELGGCGRLSLGGQRSWTPELDVLSPVCALHMVATP